MVRRSQGHGQGSLIGSHDISKKGCVKEATQCFWLAHNIMRDESKVCPRNRSSSRRYKITEPSLYIYIYIYIHTNRINVTIIYEHSQRSYL